MHFNFYLAASKPLITKDRKEKNLGRKNFLKHTDFPLPSVSYQTHDIACRAYVIPPPPPHNRVPLCFVPINPSASPLSIAA